MYDAIKVGQCWERKVEAGGEGPYAFPGTEMYLEDLVSSKGDRKG